MGIPSIKEIQKDFSAYKLSDEKFIRNAPVLPAIINGCLSPAAPHDLDMSLCLRHINEAQAITHTNQLALQESYRKSRSYQPS